MIFFIFLSDVCPWFPQEGTIDKKCWNRVGDCLNDYYKTFGPSKVPVTAFSYWNLIREILMGHFFDPDIQKVVETGETILKAAPMIPMRLRLLFPLVCWLKYKMLALRPGAAFRLRVWPQLLGENSPGTRRALL